MVTIFFQLTIQLYNHILFALQKLPNSNLIIQRKQTLDIEFSLWTMASNGLNHLDNTLKRAFHTPSMAQIIRPTLKEYLARVACQHLI